MHCAREGHIKVSSFVYLVDDSQSPKEVQTHRLHLQVWSRILGTPPKPRESKFLVSRRNLQEILAMRSIWVEHISGPEVVLLTSHQDAAKSVRDTIKSGTQMIVQLREELQTVPLRKTTVGKHYVEVLETYIESLEQEKEHKWKVWKKPQDPNARLCWAKRELRHWKKCTFPQKCRGCPYIE